MRYHEGARPRARLEGMCAFSFAGLLCATVMSCGGDAGRGGSAATSSGAGVAPAAELESSPPPAAADVPGAAQQVAEAPPPEDDEPLASRYEPRTLPIPHVRAGRSASFRVDGERRGWFARLPDGPQGLLTPAFAKGHLFLGGGFTSSRFFGINAHTGAIDWVTQAEDGGPTAAIIEDDKVIFNTESCTLFVVDVETGRLRWKRWLGDPLMGQAAAAEGRVFSGHVRDGGGFGFTAMRLTDGRVLWTRSITADVMNAPVLEGDSAYFTTMDGVVWRLEQETGRVLWRQRLQASSAPWLDGDFVHVTRRQSVRDEETRRSKRMEQGLVLAKATGNILTEHDAVEAAFVPARPDTGGTEAGWAYEGSRPTIVDGRLYQTIGAEVQSRDAATGELLWRRRYAEATRRRPATSPAVAGSQLVFGTSDGVLYGLDIDTGMTTWAYSVGEPISAQPTVANGWVYASTTRGGLVGIEVSDRTLDGWHMWGGNARHNGTSEPAAATPAESDGDGDRPSEGVLQLGGALQPGELAGFPLKGTTVHASVRGFVARVTVEQTFENPYQRPVEAVYLFPLPDDSAVDAMELSAGDRVVRGEIRRREQAQREYRAARQRGVLASLLEQERPNLFRQSVANIRPGDEVRVSLSYTQVLPYEEGSYRFVYPMVAGPRYTPAAAGDDEDAPAAQGSNIRQVTLAGGERRDRVRIAIDAEMGTELRGIESPTHQLRIDRRSSANALVELQDDDVAPDRDLDVRFAVAGEAPVVSAVASPPTSDGPGYLTLAVHPRLRVPDAEITPREIVFLVDTSSSMHGRPMELARAAMLQALDGLRESDTFRVIRFSDRASELSDEPLAATRENIGRGKQFVRGLQALGATEMGLGITAALSRQGDPGRMRIVLLMTDGYIGNEADVLRAVNEQLGQARVFAFGVGSAVNRYLLTRLAEVGRGDLQVVTLDESPEEAATRFHERISKPYLTDIQLDWGGLQVSDVYPRRAPDLYADRPMVVHGRYAQAGDGTITLRGRVAGRVFEHQVPVHLPAASETPSGEVPSLWARARIRDLMMAMALRPTDALREEVISTGLAHRLLTQWTSFVAVDEGYRTGDDGEPLRVNEPSTLPAGVDYGGAARVSATSGGHGGIGGLTMSAVGRGSGYGYGFGGSGVGYGVLALRAPRGDVEAALAEDIPAPATSLESSPSAVSGSLSRSAISTVMGTRRAAVRRCYEEQLRLQPELAGRLQVRITIGPSGTVTDATIVSNTLANPAVGTCVERIMRATRFPEPAGGGELVVSYPFVFQPGRPDD